MGERQGEEAQVKVRWICCKDPYNKGEHEEDGGAAVEEPGGEAGVGGGEDEVVVEPGPVEVVAADEPGGRAEAAADAEAGGPGAAAGQRAVPRRPLARHQEAQGRGGTPSQGGEDTEDQAGDGRVETPSE